MTAVSRRRIRRRIAVWLLALALPWHGIAVAAMSHSQAAPATNAAAAMPCHESGDAAANAAQHGTSSPTQSTPCGACAACCGLASLPALAPPAAPLRISHRVDVAPLAVHVAFLTDGPLRPPRLPVVA